MKLRFRARGTALVQNLDAMEARIKRFIGFKYTQLEAPTQENPDGRWAFVPTNEVAEVPARGEYVKACRDGDLWPADAETAAYCGVSFDPNFGAPKAEKPTAKTDKSA